MDLNRSCSLIGHSRALPCVEPITDTQSIPQVLALGAVRRQRSSGGHSLLDGSVMGSDPMCTGTTHSDGLPYQDHVSDTHSILQVLVARSTGSLECPTPMRPHHSRSRTASNNAAGRAQRRASIHTGEEDLTMDDLVKIVTEKAELLKAKQDEIADMKDMLVFVYKY